jgi:hypothetical protein
MCLLGRKESLPAEEGAHAMKRFRVKKKPTKAKPWRLVLETTEAALNLYSILWSFRSEMGAHVLNDEDLAYVEVWLGLIESAVPSILTLAEDERGPFRERDNRQIHLVMPLDDKERELMLFICQLIYQQMLQPEERERWIQNQGQADYDMAVTHYRGWIGELTS